MKKLPLLVALSLFTLGTATVVKAQEPGDATIPVEPVEAQNDIPSEDIVEDSWSSGEDGTEMSSEELELDLNGDGIVDDEERAAAEQTEPVASDELPLEEGQKENLKEGLKQTEDPSTTDADGDGVTADQDQDDSDATVGAVE